VNIFGKTLIPLFLAAVMLASCSSGQSTPTRSQADIMETAVATVSTAFAETQMAIPTSTPSLLPLPTVSFNTLTPSSVPTLGPSSTPLVFTDPSIPLSERIVYYYFVTPAENPIPEGTVRAGHPLAPAYADETYTADTSADLRIALEIVLHDGRNYWRGNKLEIVDVTFGNGHADVVLQGEYFAAGGGPLWAASWQILMTVFANPVVQTATVSINGGAISNMGISRSEDTKPADYVYTRAEIESFMKENAYVSP
jgi:hypothetical protein